MERMNRLNEELLDDETNPELLDIMRRVATDLQELLLQFKAIAKAKGIRYNIAAAKKDAIEAHIRQHTSNDGSVSLDKSSSMFDAASRQINSKDNRPVSSVEIVD